MKYTFVINWPPHMIAVQVEDRNLGSAVRKALQHVVDSKGDAVGNLYQVVFACEGWPQLIKPEECAAAAK